MANLRCDECGGSTNSFGSWSTPVKILCETCSEKNKIEKLCDFKPHQYNNNNL